MAAKKTTKQAKKQGRAPRVKAVKPTYTVEVRHGDGTLHHAMTETFPTKEAAQRAAVTEAQIVGQPGAMAFVHEVSPQQRKLVHTHKHEVGTK